MGVKKNEQKRETGKIIGRLASKTTKEKGQERKERSQEKSQERSRESGKESRQESGKYRVCKSRKRCTKEGVVKAWSEEDAVKEHVGEVDLRPRQDNTAPSRLGKEHPFQNKLDVKKYKKRKEENTPSNKHKLLVRCDKNYKTFTLFCT